MNFLVPENLLSLPTLLMNLLACLIGVKAYFLRVGFSYSILVISACSKFSAFYVQNVAEAEVPKLLISYNYYSASFY